MTMQISVLALLCLVPVIFCHVDVIRNINELIISDYKDTISDHELKTDYFRELLDELIDTYNHADHDVITEFSTACGSPVNKTVCRETLNNLCTDIPTLLHHTIENNPDEISVTDLFPSVIFYESSKTCGHHSSVQKHKRTRPSSAKAWGYGIGFVALICTISNIGSCMTPFMSKRYFQRILLYCVALAVGTLAGTGMLVLIPESMHLTEEDSPIPDYHVKMSAVLGGVYFFYVSERLMKMYFGRIKKKKTKKTDIVIGEDTTSPTDDDYKVQLTSDGDNGHSHFPVSIEDKEDVEGNEEVPETTKKKKKEVATVAWMILVGDSLHNFVDGIAIGAAFTENVYLGVSVSLAIVCEELPHELGDIAILLHAGLSMKRALCYNFLAAVVCFAGLIIGILVGENSDANVWIFAVAGGMFVYIALVDMLPEMANQYDHVTSEGIESPCTTFVIQNLGLLSGFVIIFILVLYGGNIEV